MKILGVRFKRVAVLWGSVLWISSALVACSHEDASLSVSEINTEIVVSQTGLTSAKDGLNPEASSDAIQYQMPTYIGGDQAAQDALYKQLKSSVSLSTLEQKQWLLLRLSLFASDKDQTLKRLEDITDSLTQASEQSVKNGEQDYELMAALGSALSYQSIFYQNDLGSMNLLSRKGMRYMDRAVKKAPNHLGVRLLRGISYANMPAFLNRASFAVTDLTLLKNNVLKNSVLKNNVLKNSELKGSELNASLISEAQVKKTSFKKQDKLFVEFINYFLALSLSKNEQLAAAKKLWQTLESNPDSQWSALASTRLKEG